MAAKKSLYKVSFINQGEAFEVFVHKVYPSDMAGFITIEDFDFGRKGVVVDPGAERLEREFAGVKRCFIPMHAVVRIDEVEKTGPAKITAIGDKVAHLPNLPHTSDNTRKKN